MIDYEITENSLKALSAQLENYAASHKKPGLTELDQEAIAESVIQRFETAYDTVWKVLKRFLTEERGIVDAPNSPKPVFRSAHDNSLLSGTIEAWLTYADARTATAHDYIREKAAETLKIIPAFSADASATVAKLRNLSSTS